MCCEDLGVDVFLGVPSRSLSLIVLSLYEIVSIFE
ncbi:unnamed protein product [Acanthoscelides obtectus]|uniref:Uncharacterized protein n=1 Tax=Acanthoscelides obtectus TaxID=200917 RepID=A0A9P0KF91_ACAOB|nr:unnamed protein product [Acanthoscelides obtectus]CAK1657676.1 hypothetical protein AOBTE_LOCUS20472 [Acanthoscelides obtectus]